MPNFETATDPSLDSVFHALADPTRRAVIAQLSSATEPASVSDLAKPFDMALPSFMQHLRVLEAAGLVTTRKTGRVRTCEVQAAALATAEDWIATQRAFWEGRLDRLDAYLTELQAGSDNRED